MSDLSDTELEQLLPFYVNGTLSAEEAGLVEARLEESEALRHERAYLQALRQRIQDMPEDEAPGEMGLQRLKREIRDAGDDAQTAPASNDNVAGVSTWWKPLAVAACVALVVLSGLNITGYFGPSEEGGLQTASSGGSLNGPVLQIFFAATAREADIRQLLHDNSLNIIGGPSAAGFYRIEFKSKTSPEQAMQMIAKLKATSVVEDIEKE